VDFAQRVLSGEVLLTLREPSAGPLDLDTRDLRIGAVETPEGAPLRYELGAPERILGTRLRVQLPPATRAIRVRYSTSPQASALPQPIPPYLLAFAVGDLSPRQLSQRSAVWAERSVADAAAWELDGVETMMQVAEDLFGPYEWERYDILVMPPSFPFGGMENPRLTFATPSLLAGDRSLVNVIAHELAHAWTGNLVSNATLEHFWLNEGFTV